MDQLTSTVSPRMWRGWPLVLALVCGAATYSDSFRGPFIFDDIDGILNNPQVNRGMSARGEMPTTLSGRPVLRASFQVDYAIGGMNVWVYHATNLVIHLACGCVLFGILRRNLCGPFWAGKYADSGHWLAGAVVAIWLVHPLNTEAVTYISQRAESLAGLFYLLVIYCVIRDWKAGAVIACALGMGTKETVATAPIVALLYDRTFIAGSFGAALKARRGAYGLLAGTWVILIAIVASGARSKSVGNILPEDYAITQLGVIGHYLGLAVWPADLVLDYYDWPIAHSIGLGGGVILGLLALTAFALWWKPWLGFLGAWFFLVLGPSSSVIPVFTEVAAEHRMYLPVIAVVVFAVVGGWVLLSRNWIGIGVAGLFFIFALVGLSARTFLRNAEYRDAVTIWADTVAQRPGNPRAHFNLGYSLLNSGKPALAADEFRRALELEPHYYAAGRLLGVALRESGEMRGAARP